MKNYYDVVAKITGVNIRSACQLIAEACIEYVYSVAKKGVLEYRAPIKEMFRDYHIEFNEHSANDVLTEIRWIGFRNTYIDGNYVVFCF